MQFKISGHHVDITDAIREAVETKFHKVESHYPDLEAISVTLTVEKNEQKIEADTQYLGAPVAVHASAADMYIAIGDAAKKLESALSHRKGVLHSNKHGQSARA